ncbi:MAG: hypothetical protein JSV52_05985 [Candidatus Zixiibacteriota bacterium]|nr:MAG: hypothetical protein JSV52_05985 [candidate division Zixibacteria bacterium]
MNSRLRLIPRIALFAALIYVFSWGTSYLPNINLAFFIAFYAGVFWGILPGALVGALGMALWTLFNPFGPAYLQVMVAQVIGMALSGVVGAAFRAYNWHLLSGKTLSGYLLLAAIVCTLLFYLPVNVIDAWLYQPFWPRFIGGMLWAVISLVANMVIFSVLFRPVRLLYNKGKLN